MNAEPVAEPAFDMEVRRVGDSGVLTLTGELDVENAPRVSEALDWLCQQGYREVNVDLHDVDFLDSSGLAAFIRAHQALASTGRELVLNRPSRSIRRLLGVTGLAGEFTVR